MGASQEKVETTTGAESPHDTQFGDSTVPKDPLFLFACHLAWHRDGDVNAYQELVAALDDRNPDIRAVAENLLHRLSPRPCPPVKAPIETD